MTRRRRKELIRIAAGVVFVTVLIAAVISDWAELKSQEETEAAEVTAVADEEAEDTVRMWTDRDAELIAKTLYKEAGSSRIPPEEKAAVVWCILNRVDAGYGSIERVVTAPHQFTGYHESNPVKDSLLYLTIDVLERWQAEKEGARNVGRTLPKEYLYFTGDGDRNHFTKKWQSADCWDWSLPSPYQPNEF